MRNSFTYPILILCQMIYLHFCGAWVYRQSDAQAVDKLIIINAHAVKYIANTAENTFSTARELILS